MTAIAVSQDWRHRAACLGVNPDIFHLPDSDTKGVNPHQRRRDWADYALQWCYTCPVTAECLADASPADLKVSVRGGRAPDMQPPGRPRKALQRAENPGTKGPASQWTPAALREAVEPLLREGWGVKEISRHLAVSDYRVSVIRKRFLVRLTSGPATCAVSVLKPRPDGNGYYTSKSNGPAWLVSASECGRVLLVAFNKEGRVRTRFFPATQIKATRIDGRMLKKFPADLLPGE